MPYRGRCASCDAGRGSDAFASSPNGKPIPRHATAKHVPHRSTANHRICNGCRQKIDDDRSTSMIDLTNEQPLSHKEKVAIGEKMRRLLHDDGSDDCVSLPNSRGPSTTWWKLTTPRVDNNDCSPETLRRRAKTMESVRERLSTVSDNSDKENKDSVRRLQLAEVTRQPEEYVAIMRDAGLTVDHKLLANETVQLQTLLKLPHRTIRMLRSFLQQHGIDIFTSEKTSRRHVTTLRHALETGTVKWKIKEKNKQTGKVTLNDKDVTFARVVDVAAVLNSQLDELIRTGRFKYHGCIPEGHVWCSLVGDKGGHSVKLGVNIINNETPLSRSSVYILAIYEGAGENYELINKIMKPVIDQVYQWKQTLLETKELHADIFVGGDFPWMSIMNGLSDLGQYFCLHCLCSQNALAADRGVSHSPAKKRYDGRTFEHNCEHNRKYQMRGCRKEYAQDYFNCINPPLVGAESSSHNSAMPLHVFLGLGGDIPYNILQTETAALDESIRREHPTFQIGHADYQYSFTASLNRLMKDLCVSRKGNRGHTFVGNDVHTMLQAENRERLCALLEARTVLPSSSKLFGNSVAAAKLRKLLDLISKLYQLTTAARGLSDDEIERVKSLSIELAEFYPQNYPERTITPKFHVATHHFSEFAVKYRTVGLVSEHCLESTHAEFKKYDQRFACDGNGEVGLKASLQQNMLEHDARLGAFSLQRRCCSDCGRELRQLGKRIRTEPDIVRCACKSQSQEQ